jgi:hypothetical protein
MVNPVISQGFDVVVITPVPDGSYGRNRAFA